MFSSIMTVCGTLISIYTFIIIARIIISWFAGGGYGHGYRRGYGRVFRLFTVLTDPYLNFFRRCTFFHFGPFDFSPVFALIILSVAGNVFQSLADFQQITCGLVLALLVVRLWAAAAFFIGLYIFLTLLRLVGVLVRLNSASPFWRYIDMVLNPVLLPLTRLIFRGRRVSYITALVSGALSLLALRFGGAALIERLALLIQRIPF
ncbi:MAG: YggT family protein [Spirochaetales bacterium]|jgi:YggT family protein|nr:YggT family protein [Spirochaetales bacterium]